MTRKIKRYLVLKGCRNDRTQKSYEPGDIVTHKDFAAGVLKHWAEKEPPALQEVPSGSDTKR